jgi:hypothetical protein
VARELKPVRFVPVERAFKPQVKVRALVDLNGWVHPRRERIKWSISAGQVGCLDADTAREFQAKGYVQVLDGEVKPVSDGEREELLAQTSTVTLGVPNG